MMFVCFVHTLDIENMSYVHITGGKTCLKLKESMYGYQRASWKG